MPAKHTLTEKALTKVRSHIENRRAKNKHFSIVTAEDVAKRLSLKCHIVKQAFHKLNLEGVLSTPMNQSRKMWREPAATTYLINEEHPMS